MHRYTLSRAMQRVLPAVAAAAAAAAPAAARANLSCGGKVACIQAPGARLNVDRVQLWGPMGSAVNGAALVAVWVDVVDQRGPRAPNTYALGSLSPGALDPNYADSYFLIDGSQTVNADYTNGCTFKTANPQTDDPYISGPYGFTADRLLYPGQRENHRAICFAVNSLKRGFTFVWYPNGRHLDGGRWSHGYRVHIPAARPYGGGPTPTN